MNDSTESLKKNTNRKMKVLRAKTKTRTGFWNVRMTYETGKLAQVTAETRQAAICAFLELARVDGKEQPGKEPTRVVVQDHQARPLQVPLSHQHADYG